MPKQDMKRLEQKEKEREDKAKVQGGSDEKAKPQLQAEIMKRWKGKDWFAVMAPKLFGEIFLYDTPAIDPKLVIGRKVEIPVPFLTNDKTKNHMKIVFRVNDVQDKSAHTVFDSYFCSREFIARNVRKRCQKLDVTNYVDTKDNWRLQVTTTAILNRNVKENVETKMHNLIESGLKEMAATATLDEFIKNVISSVYQKKLRKDGTKIYPVRFTEISKVEVIKAPAA